MRSYRHGETRRLIRLPCSGIRYSKSCAGAWVRHCRRSERGATCPLLVAGVFSLSRRIRSPSSSLRSRSSSRRSTFVTPLAPLPPPYMSHAGSFMHFASPAAPALPVASPRFTHSNVLCSSFSLCSWVCRPSVCQACSPGVTVRGLLRKGRLPLLGKVQWDSLRGLSLRATTLAPHGSIHCLQQLPRRLCCFVLVFFSYSESPAGPVRGSVADRDHAYGLPASRSFGPVLSLVYRVAYFFSSLKLLLV